ncbi:tubulin delta chain-like isoform X1 [Babylonia areolata]|uniref:tubulin delta chain-like isoform X1 n=1 Tax=Babylonia areolata TaxID=304850 RepID=UPI003FD68A17
MFCLRHESFRVNLPVQGHITLLVERKFLPNPWTRSGGKTPPVQVMSTVFLHVGQCGNQVSQPLWKCIERDGAALESRTFTSHDGWHRAVHVDSEPKVIKHLPKVLKIREKNIIAGKRGRGTNWALGYHGLKCSGDDHLLQNTLDAVRTEVERCDMFSGIIMTHSLSGGTGSGFGSRLAEALRDNYPMNHLLSVTFAPCASGESPLQHYNALMCLATLQRNVDGILLIQNDDILDRATKRSPDSLASFTSLNKVIGQSLAGLFLPTDTLATSRDVSLGQEPWEMLRVTCPVPATKFIHSMHVAKSKLSWEGLVSQCLHTMPRYSTGGLPFSTLSGVVVARGDTTGSFPASLQHGVSHRIRKAWNCVDWNPCPLYTWTAFQNTCGPKDSASISMAVNSSCVTQYLDTICQRSKVMLEAGAYLHWYERYNTSKEDMEEAVSVLQVCQDDYREATMPG